MRRLAPLAACLPLFVAACDEASSPSGGADAGALATDAGQADAGADASDAGGADHDAGVNAPDASVDAPDAGADAPDAGGVQPGQSGLELDLLQGRARGVADGDLRIFKGIPFAEAPVGPLRFAPPVPAGPWAGTLEADEFGPGCAQAPLGPELLLGDFARETSEDCLTLNVWAHDDAGPRPVMLWIYGGGFVSGDAAWPTYDATQIARRTGAVVVTINYRLGLFGFLAHEALAAEHPDGVSGNMGIRDQIEALRWVRGNIAAFGGDPENVTIFGESAGAISVCALLGAPSADGLRHKAIMQSGQCVLSVTDETTPLAPKTIYDYGREAVEALGCAEAPDIAACLRALPAETLADAASATGLASGDLTSLGAVVPHVDGALIPDQPILRLGRGEADVPFIVGSNENEGSLLAFSDVVLTWFGLPSAIETFTGLDAATADAVAQLYPFGDFLTPNEAWLAFLGDFTFVCPGLSAARAASGGNPAFTYHFTRSPLLARAVGAGHGMDLVYVFGTFESLGILPTSADERVSETMQRAWGTFAARGEPDLSAGWPAYDALDPSIAILDDPPELTDELRNGRCAELERLGLVGFAP